MKTLLTLFGKERNNLETEIEQTTSHKQVVKLVQAQLDSLEKSYIGELNVRQVRLVKILLDTLRQSLFNINTIASETVIASPERQTIQADRSPSSLLLKLLQLLVGLAILVSLFSLTEATPAAWMTILLLCVLVGLQAVVRFNKAHDQADYPSSPAPQHVPVDSKILLDDLASALSSIDQAVAETQVQKLLGSGGIEEIPGILDFLQKLAGASSLGNPLMTLELTKLLPQILLEQGIKVQNYQPQDQHSREYFEFEPHIDRAATDYVTITPALVRGDRLLRRGRVIEPVYSEVNNASQS